MPATGLFFVAFDALYLWEPSLMPGLEPKAHVSAPLCVMTPPPCNAMTMNRAIWDVGLRPPQWNITVT